MAHGDGSPRRRRASAAGYPATGDDEWEGGPEMDRMDLVDRTAARNLQTWQRLLSESEGRTNQAIAELRGDIQAMTRTYLPLDRAQDRWKQQDASDTRIDLRVAATERAVQEIQQAIPKLATKDDLVKLIKDEIQQGTKGYVSRDDVERTIAAAHQKQLETIRNWVILAIMVLSFLAAVGVINIKGLFGAAP